MSPLNSSISQSFSVATTFPKIVTDGLVLNLDAGQQNSYNGSGTTWTDLSGRGNTGTLTNGPTYSSANGGSIIFDGTDDYWTKSNLVRIGGKNIKCTVEIAFYLPSGKGGYLVTNEREGGGNGHGWYYCDTDSSGSLGKGLYFTQHSRVLSPFQYYCYASSTGFSNIKIDGWNYVSFSVNVGITSMSCDFLINGYTETITNNSLVFDGTEATTDDNIDIGRWRNHIYGTSYSNIRVSSVRIYNRNLTQTEQFQNYNSIRSRFNI